MQYYDSALKIAREEGIKQYLALVLSNIANLYAEEGNFDGALSYYLSGLKINQEIGDKSGMANSYSAIGALYLGKKNTPEALKNYYTSLTLYEEIGDKNALLNLYNSLGKVYLEQKAYSEVLNLANKALALSKETGLLRQTEHAYMLLSQVDSAQGNYKSALENHKLYIATRDSIMNEDNIEKITRQQMQFDFDKQTALTMAEQEKKDALMREEIHHHRVIGNLYLIIGSSIIAIAILVLVLFRQKARKNRVITDQQIRQLQEEKKLLAARFLVEGQEKERKRIAQELHDGLGVLLSVTKMQFSQIASYSIELQPMIAKAVSFLDQASGDVRRISHNMMPGLLTKMGLFEALEDLFENITDSHKIEAKIEIQGNRDRLPENKEIMLYRVVQEMVNNTLKYAEATKIELQIETLSDQVKIHYTDNGKGFTVNDGHVKDSLGLKSIKSRVRFLDGKIKLDSAPGKGTQYHVEVPL
jgi:two-component system NarL family sensor kinase